MIRVNSDITVNEQCHSVALTIWIGHDDWEGPGSIVSIATGYGLDSPGIECWWGRDFPHLSRPPLGSTHPPVEWVRGLSRG